MKNKQKGFIIPLIIIIVAALAIWGGVSYSKKNAEVSTKVDTSAETSQSDSTAVSKEGDSAKEESSWKTYTNTKVGFSFSYPSDWSVKDSLTLTSCCLNITNQPSYSSDSPSLPKDFILLQVQRHTKLASETLINIASRPPELGGEREVSSFSVAGLAGVKSTSNVGAAEVANAIYYLPKSQTEYLIVMVFRGQQVSTSTEAEILASIRFTK